VSPRLGSATLEQLALALQGLGVEWVRPPSGSPSMIAIQVIKDGYSHCYSFAPSEPLYEVARQIKKDMLARAPS
jgi:hypothetical protein